MDLKHSLNSAGYNCTYVSFHVKYFKSVFNSEMVMGSFRAFWLVVGQSVFAVELCDLRDSGTVLTSHERPRENVNSEL